MPRPWPAAPSPDHPRDPGPEPSLGNRDLLAARKLALFCSRRCPGTLILRTYDLARDLRDAGVTVVGGFHSPMEQECLRLLLRGASPVIVCPARGLPKRVPPAWQAPIQQGRLLVLSPFDAAQRRQTRELAARRNAFVATLADALCVAYADPGGATQRLCADALVRGTSVLTFDELEAAPLRALGAQPLTAGWDWTAWRSSAI